MEINCSKLLTNIQGMYIPVDYFLYFLLFTTMTLHIIQWNLLYEQETKFYGQLLFFHKIKININILIVTSLITIMNTCPFVL
jgi:hypothetical protein